MKKGGYFITVVLLILCVVLAFLLRKEKNMDTNNNSNYSTNVKATDFEYKMIQMTNNIYSKKNYMISPLSMGYALSLLKEGAQYDTLKEINSLLGDYKLNKAYSIKDRIGIANLIFISNKYKDDINTNYIKLLNENYDSEVLFDDFKTPKVVNNWIKDKTFNMIKDPINNIPKDFVLGLANTIAIDVEWGVKFDAENTYEQDFTKEDNSNIKVAMMHGKNDAAYIESKKAKGIIKDYAVYDKTTGERTYGEDDNSVALEYIAILPNDNIDKYIKKFDINELHKLIDSKKYSDDKTDIKYSLPKYTYDFDYDEFKNALKNLGMNKAFETNADFKKMIKEDSKTTVFVNDAIHKTHIELTEDGTKAAAATIFMMVEGAMLEKPKDVIEVNFNRPFIYIIKEKNKDNIWFFGTVYEPMLWKDNNYVEEK